MPGGGRWETSREPSIDTEEGRHCKHSNYAIRVVHSPVDAERDESNHAHIVLILLQSYHTNTDRMYHICKKLYHICNFQRNLLENVRDMYTLRQIGISFL